MPQERGNPRTRSHHTVPLPLPVVPLSTMETIGIEVGHAPLEVARSFSDDTLQTTGARIDEVTSLLLSDPDSPPPRSWTLSAITAPLQAIQWAAATWRAIIGSRTDAPRQPSRERVREHVALVHQCAVEFNSQPASTGEPVLVQTGILMNSLFDRYFFPKFRGAPPADPEPVFDLLLQVVDSERRQGLPPVLRTGNGLAVIILLCMPSSPAVEDTSPYTLFALRFLANLKNIWDAKKEQRLAAESVSPMPWSAASRSLEDQRFVLVQFARMDPTIAYAMACRESGIPQSSADFLHIPPMRWLGATHDDHSNFVSVHVYALARYQMGHSLLDHVALWQSALTFGLLEAITGLIIPECSFLWPRGDGNVLFTSHRVSALAFTVGLRLYLEPNHTRRRLLADHALSTMEWACKALSEELVFGASSHRSLFWSTGIADSEVDDFVCCIYSLLAVFRLVLTSVMQQKSLEIGEPFFQSRYNSPDDYQDIVGRVHQSYTRRMLGIGWCPYTLAKLRKTDSEVAVILGILGMEKPAVRHRPDEHAACTEESCTVHNVDPATYTTQHTTPTCSCLFITPTFSDVDDLLSRGDIPVVIYDSDRLSVRRAADGPYVAISHVWADGLGSTTEKGLPTCQVSRISSFAGQLVPCGAFWIDGLCVPEVKHLRKGAIRLMAQTYRGAEKVIVLDAGIRSHCSMSRTPAENILRVKTSVWMQRIWTMHEAFLARELYFEFSDGLVSGSTIRKSLEPSAPLSGHPVVVVDPHERPPGLRHSRPSRGRVQPTVHRRCPQDRLLHYQQARRRGRRCSRNAGHGRRKDAR
ncbi:hypothetical protein OH76DRAFT_1520448 [Lentinus brumalis]|uniref:Heterokaryon incompatibility domain-containing protein n=1 Tax=Lentinus brumalis TaxID=2498619 RepID=A0A371D8P4_9APHY|nr:hypothetical protein OH76DRAFT_1520448 [Polyporus brumalis]